MDISIIIVNYKTPELTINCIQSIYKHTKCSFEIILVDNNSQDGIEGVVSKKFPKVKLIQIGYNSGFAKANNEAIKIAQADFTILLNSDTVLVEDIFSKCISYWRESSENIGLLGCKLRNPDATLQLNSFWGANTIKRTWHANPIIIFFNKLLGIEHPRKIYPSFQIKDQEKCVDWISGAFMMMDTQTLKKEKFYLDEDFFMYSEDIELGFRVNKKGYKVVYYPFGSVIHLGGGGTNVPLTRRPQLMISSWLCLLKTKGRVYFLLNQVLLTINLLLDEFLFLRRKYFFKRSISISDLKAKLIRRLEWHLLLKYTKPILMFSSKTSSSTNSLKFNR